MPSATPPEWPKSSLARVGLALLALLSMVLALLSGMGLL
jgi:hypothetical protein